MTGYLNEINWYELLTVNFTADSLWESFSSVLYDAINCFVPTRVGLRKATTKTAKIKTYPLKIRRAMARKRCLWKKYRSSPSNETLKLAYSSAEARSRLLLKDSEIKKEMEVIQSDNAGNFFKYVNKKLSNTKGIGALIEDANQVVNEDADKANMFNAFFASNCVVNNGITPEPRNVAPNNASLDSIDFNPSSVLRALKKVKSNESSDPDGFPPLLFHKLANCRKPSFCYLQVLHVCG